MKKFVYLLLLIGVFIPKMAFGADCDEIFNAEFLKKEYYLSYDLDKWEEYLEEHNQKVLNYFSIGYDGEEPKRVNRTLSSASGDWFVFGNYCLSDKGEILKEKFHHNSFNSSLRISITKEGGSITDFVADHISTNTPVDFFDDIADLQPLSKEEIIQRINNNETIYYPYDELVGEIPSLAVDLTMFDDTYDTFKALKSGNFYTSQTPLYSDLPFINAHYDAVSFLTNKEALEGYPDGTFRPENPVNRAEFTKILSLATADESEIGACELDQKFADVEEDAWYRSYLCHAVSRGVIEGYPDGTFRPEGEINLAEVATMITREFRWDENPGQEWYDRGINALKSRDILQKTTLTNPDDIVSRGQMVELIYQATLQ